MVVAGLVGIIIEQGGIYTAGLCGMWIRIHFFADPDPAVFLNADPDPLGLA